MSKTVKQAQQELAELFGARNIIPWDLYNSNDKEFLTKKIEFLIPLASGSDKKTVKENEKLKDARKKIVEAAWNQRKYNGGHLLMSIIYIAWTKASSESRDSLRQTQYGLYPLLRIRKCRTLEGNSENCCMIFIDDNGRVYENWDDYYNTNKLPEGVIVGPKNGYYSLDENIVLLEYMRTPASRTLNKIGDVVKTGAGVIGLGAGAVTIAAAAIPVAPVVLIGATVAGIGSGIIGAFSSVKRLVDRGQHEESINVTDPQARGDWIGVAGGVVSLGASGATTALARYASTGKEVSTIATGAVNGLNIAAIAVNGVGVGNSAIDMIIKIINDEEISSMDVLQLGASLFLVTHSVYNFRTASAIVNRSRDNQIISSREQLSSRQKKAFDRTYQETVRLKGPNQGKMDVIRSLKNMPDSKQPLNDLYKVNKQMNQNGMKASFHPDGRIVINNDLVVSGGELRQNLQHGVGESIAQRVAPAPTSYPAENANIIRTPNSVQNLTSDRNTMDIAINLIGIVGTTVVAAIEDAESFEDCVNNILSHVTKRALNILLRFAGEFHSQFAAQLQQLINRSISLEEILWKVFEMVRKLCDDGDIDKFIENLKAQPIFEKLKNLYLEQAPQTGLEKKCSKCCGYFMVC